MRRERHQVLPEIHAVLQKRHHPLPLNTYQFVMVSGRPRTVFIDDELPAERLDEHLARTAECRANTTRRRSIERFQSEHHRELRSRQSPAWSAHRGPIKRRRQRTNDADSRVVRKLAKVDFNTRLVHWA